MAEQKEDFQARIARINGGQAPVAENVYVPERKPPPVPKSRGAEIMENSVYPLSIVGAFLLGVVAVVFGRYAQYHALGSDSSGMAPDSLLMVDYAFAFGIAFLVRNMFNLRLKEHLAAKSLGITVAIATIHNAVHAAPGIWAFAFSEEWVANVTAITEPNSIYFGGISFLL